MVFKFKEIIPISREYKLITEGENKEECILTAKFVYSLTEKEWVFTPRDGAHISKEELEEITNISKELNKDNNKTTEQRKRK